MNETSGSGSRNKYFSLRFSISLSPSNIFLTILDYWPDGICRRGENPSAIVIIESETFVCRWRGGEGDPKGKKIPGRFRLPFLLLPVEPATEQSAPPRSTGGKRIFVDSAGGPSFHLFPLPRVPNAISSAPSPFLLPSSLVVNFQDDAYRIQVCAQLCGFEGHFVSGRGEGNGGSKDPRTWYLGEEKKAGAGAARETRRSIRLINSLICPPTRTLHCAGRALDRITV